MYRTYATPLQLDIRSSRQSIVLLTIIVLFVVISLLLVSLAMYFKFLFLMFFLFFTFLSYKNINNEKTVVWKEGNEWELVEAGVSQSASLLADSFISQWVSILNFKLQNNKIKTVLVFSDAIQSQQYRMLRVRLKVEGV